MHFVIALLIALQSPSLDQARVIKDDELVESRVDRSDPVLSSKELDLHRYPGFLPRGKVFAFTPEQSGSHVLEARSHTLELSARVRNDTGQVIGEDNQTLWGILPGLKLEGLVTGKAYRIEVVSLYGDPGSFDLRVRAVGEGASVANGGSLPTVREQGLEFVEGGVDLLDREGADRADLGVALGFLGNVLRMMAIQEVGSRRKRHLNRALEELDRALALLENTRGDHPSTARVLQYMAIAADARKDLDAAETIFRKRLSMLDRLVPDGNYGAATCCHNLANVLWQRGKNEEAIECCQRAGTMFHAFFGAEHSMTAFNESLLGVLYLQQGKFADAERILRQTLDTQHRLQSPPSQIIDTMNNLANALSGQGKFGSAEIEFKKTLELVRTFFADPNSAFAMDYSSISHSGIGVLLLMRGRYVQSEQSFRKALELKERLYSRSHPKLATTYHNLGVVLYAQGRYPEAQDYLNRAVESYRKSGVVGRCANSLSKLADVLERQGEVDEAKKLLVEAKEILDSLGGDHGFLRALILNSLACFLQRHGRAEEAEELFSEALTILRPLLSRNNPDVATILLNLGVVSFDANRIDEAEQYRTEALSILTETYGDGHPDVVEARAKLADIRLVRKDWSGAEKRYREAAETLESSRARSAGMEEGRARLSEVLAFPRVTASLADVLLRQGKLHEALAASESGKGRSLLDLLARSDRDLLAELRKESPEKSNKVVLLLEKEDAAREDVFTQNHLLRLMENRSREKKATATQVERVAAAERRLRDATGAVFAELGRAMPDAKPMSPRELREVLKEGELFLSYTWSWNSLIVLLVPPAGDGKLLGEIALDGKSELEQMQRDLRDLSKSLRNRGERFDENRARQVVDRILPKKLRARMAGARRVVISPDGPLNEIPFEVLLPLEEGPDFVYETSGSVFVQSRRRADGLFGSKGAEATIGERILLIGQPVLDEEPSATLLEIERIADLCRRAGLSPEVLWGEDASVPQVETKVQGSRFVHFATHAIAGTKSHPQEASLFLTRPVAPSLKDPGQLSLERMIRNWRGSLSRCELVVLSACETQSGVKVGDALMALPWGFFYAGTPTVLASLWKVDDRATALLMVRFYENLLGRFESPRTVGDESFAPGQGLPKSTALREAKIWLRGRSPKDNRRDLEGFAFRSRGKVKSDSLVPGRPPRTRTVDQFFDFTHPYFWAPFILVGSSD